MTGAEGQQLPIPTTGRLAGFDFGTRRIGIAVCDASRILASPLSVYEWQNDERDADYFRQLALEESLVGLVVGLPLYASGDESQKSFEAREFGSWLATLTGLPVAYHDERYTSVQAESLLGAASLTRGKRKKRIDKVAAQLILSSFLDSDNLGAEPGSLE